MLLLSEFLIFTVSPERCSPCRCHCILSATIAPRCDVVTNSGDDDVRQAVRTPRFAQKVKPGL
jgi:hypothetical protein